MIYFENISKAFQVAKRTSSLSDTFKSFLSRKYTTIQALNDLSFEIGKGEIVGLLGPNGAGKSTAIKIMCGILHPDSGSCEINGYVPWKKRMEYVSQIGVVFGQRSQLWWDVPVIDTFELLKDIYKIAPALYKHNMERLTQNLGLDEILFTPTRQLSLGQRMRCELAASLLHSPKVLFLDEPTIGLDAVSKLQVRKFIKELNEESGVTVILTTHDMQDVQALTNRILLIGRGKILYDGGLDQLHKKEGASIEETMAALYKEMAI